MTGPSYKRMNLEKIATSMPEGDEEIFVVAGIDPGKSGGISFLSNKGHLLHTTKTPVSKTDYLEVEIRDLLSEFGVGMAFIEKVASMPRQGVRSVFTFGSGYGLLRGICVGMRIPYCLITPQEWRKLVGLTSGESKDCSIARSQILFPYMSKHLTKDGPCESALIGLAGIRRFIQGS